MTQFVEIDLARDVTTPFHLWLLAISGAIKVSKNGPFDGMDGDESMH